MEAENLDILHFSKLKVTPPSSDGKRKGENLSHVGFKTSSFWMAKRVDSSISLFHQETKADPTPCTLWIFETELVDNIQNGSHVCDNIPSSESLKFESSL